MNNQTKEKLRIGVIGCGSISGAYMRNASLFKGVEIVACADLNPATARKRADEFGLRAMDGDALIASPDIDLVLNLTIPTAHFDVTMQALSENKHVFTEKPLGVTAAQGRKLVAAARKRGLLVGSAPDTFLGAAGRYARRMMEDGVIGTPVVGTAFMMGRGMEHWHPDPSFYYQPGGGPVLDMGPYYLTMLVNLMGPIRRVQAVSTSGQDERLITAAGPKSGTTFQVGTPTSVLSLLEFACGAMVTFGASWDVFRHSPPPIELHGTEGSLRLPDPDTFGGGVGVSQRGAVWKEMDTEPFPFGQLNWPVASPEQANYRMVGLADLARALLTGGKPRASADLALHVLEVMEAILHAGETGNAQIINATDCQPSQLLEDDAKCLMQ